MLLGRKAQERPQQSLIFLLIPPAKEIYKVTIFLNGQKEKNSKCLGGVSNPWPAGHMWLSLTINAAQHKIVSLLKTF